MIPISLLTEQPNLLVAHPALVAKSFADFIALARSQPGTLTYGSPGVGSGNHLATALLLTSLNAEMLHVPYKGTGPALSKSRNRKMDQAARAARIDLEQ